MITRVTAWVDPNFFNSEATSIAEAEVDTKPVGELQDEALASLKAYLHNEIDRITSDDVKFTVSEVSDNDNDSQTA